ncbi:hypothetical protein [Streptomyces sp. NPDC048489]|uniref:hypothetical protein n=1 Tax=Streptomyces sp. NPDC048489 TaxID=3154504 RepID=UPI0034460BC2
MNSRNPIMLPTPRSSASGTNTGHRDFSFVKSPIRDTRSRTVTSRVETRPLPQSLLEAAVQTRNEVPGRSQRLHH